MAIDQLGRDITSNFTARAAAAVGPADTSLKYHTFNLQGDNFQWMDITHILTINCIIRHSRGNYIAGTHSRNKTDLF